MTNQLSFVNHASFYVANDTSVLLVDPWVEGAVFNQGWSLLDNATSNAALVHQLSALQRNTVIWFSHEHPDHFSISFIKKLKQEFRGKLTLLFQRTKDRRVASFLQKQGFEVVECDPGATHTIDPNLNITVFPYSDGDSWCLIKSGQRSILNLNDCAMTTAAHCQAVAARIAPLTSKLDVLMTQFGYANWVGNPCEPGLRRRAATEKRERIRLQMEILRPALTIPFASFVTFSSIENQYLNDYQNSAYTIRQWSTLSPVTESLRFMQPGDDINLDHMDDSALLRMSHLAVEHWEKLGTAARLALPPEPSLAPSDVEAAFARHLANVAANLPGLPWLLERLGLIQPLTIHIADLNLLARCSYVDGYRVCPAGTPHDIAMSSNSAAFLFGNDYGFNTTHVNGRFRTAHAAALQRFSRFFMPQNLIRQGYGIRHPWATAGHLAGNVLGRMRAGAS
ncbi:MAG: MBL fold metallo-hydrolase [Massilia sp.]